jgi:hypothetical protein
LYKKKVVNMKDGRYRIYLVFMDKTSYVKWGVIQINGIPVKKFDGNYVELLLKEKVKLHYIVEDGYGNKLEGDLEF